MVNSHLLVIIYSYAATKSGRQNVISQFIGKLKQYFWKQNGGEKKKQELYKRNQGKIKKRKISF